jgi:hypothetical protein
MWTNVVDELWEKNDICQGMLLAVGKAQRRIIYSFVPWQESWL